MAEGRSQSYEKAELAAKLMDLNFAEDESIYAANECGVLYAAISYLQQDCELCASKYGVKEVKPHSQPSAATPSIRYPFIFRNNLT